MKLARTALGLAALAATAALSSAVAEAPAHWKQTPAFSKTALAAPPRDNWITNGGALNNQRYSPLNLINRGNVSQLKALWRFSMGENTARPGTSAEDQILTWNGVLYATNGDNDVFAINVETGKPIWTRKGDSAAKSGNPNGIASRGVAMGTGKIFIAQRDAIIVALDQKTGKVVWRTVAEDWRKGYFITSAPLYYDGLVITGFSGGDTGLRGRVEAFDAKTGRKRWTFYTVPAPGEFGADTWPKNSDAWTHGGGAVWQTPALDPDLGLLYISTGNPGADHHGIERAGDNLFSSSIVAIDAKTGKYRWHFQQVHHDIWDYDSPNPVVLFDALIGGKPRKGLAEVSKTGFTYILDRTNGEPLIGIEERPAPQEPRQATAATQPYPIGDAVVPQRIDIAPEGARVEPGTAHLPNYGRIFTPFWTDPVTVKPGARGGANWPPSSYDPETHLLYVCASDRPTAYSAKEELEEPVPMRNYAGGHIGPVESNENGILAAVDVTTNTLAWRQMWRQACYSGSVVTAGGLLFVGRNDGRLTALDKLNGEMLWQFMTDAGVNSTVTTFLYKAKQYVVVHAGGNSLVGSKRGDGIWMFSLDGKIDSLAPVSMTTSKTRGETAQAAPPQGAPARGAALYNQACMACHGANGEGGVGGGANLVRGQSAAYIADIAAKGRFDMPAFQDSFDAQQLADIAAYITETLGPNAPKTP
jgi:quinohemoprotein ethanol dehydrogenase